ncbi:MAG: MFS transporter [Pseudomonadota bacterium]
MALTPLSLFGYALPALFLAALYLPLFSYVTPFYVAERGVDLAAIGLLWIAIRLFDAVSDPLMGWISDRTQSRFGRRRLWLALSLPLLCVATWQAFMPPQGAGLAHAGIWLFLLTLGWTMAQTPYAAWGAEMASTYAERTRVTAWREALVITGTLAATIVYFAAGEGGDGLSALALTVCIGLPLAVVVAFALAPDRATEPPAKLTVSAGWQALRENKPFQRLILAWFANGAANGIPVTLFLFFVADRLGAPEAAGGALIAYFLAAILAVPGWTWLAGRLSKHRAWGIAMLWACAIFAGALALEEGDIAAFYAIAILTGFAFGADLALPPAIQADVIALDTQRTGARRAGLFFAMWQVVTKAALAFSSGLALIALERAGFQAGGENTPTALMTLSILYAGVPIILKLIAVALMWRFSLDRETVDALTPASSS